MGYHIELNSLLVIPDSSLDIPTLKVGTIYSLTKEQERLYPIGVPMDFCDARYVYRGKIVVHKLTIEKSRTSLEFEVLKLYSTQESKVFTENFIPIH